MIGFIIFQIQWFACVINYKNSFLLALGIFLVQLVFLARENLSLIFPLFFLSVIGVLVDSLLIYTGIYYFPNGKYFFIVPVWLMTLWFCYTLWYVKADYLNKNLILYTVLCAIFGPLSYYAGMRLRALMIAAPLFNNIIIICVCWIFLGLIFVNIFRFTSSQ